MNASLERFLKLFTFDKKRELEKYCRDVVIYSSDFANFIVACEMGRLPFLHQIHYQDHVPEHLHLSEQDTAALAANPVGPLQPSAQKAVRKIGQMFKDRRYLVGHIFYVPDLSKWHFFQFDQRDLEDERANHWKEGAHVHFLNWLWPNYDAKTVWTNFTSGKVKLNDSLHVEFLIPAQADCSVRFSVAFNWRAPALSLLSDPSSSPEAPDTGCLLLPGQAPGEKCRLSGRRKPKVRSLDPVRHAHNELSRSARM